MQEVAPANLSLIDQMFPDLAGQIKASSEKTYMYDVRTFALWMLEHDLRPETLTRSNMIAYRAYLTTCLAPHTGKPYAKNSVNRMFVVARRLLQEMVENSKLPTNPGEHIKGFKTNTETTHVALTEKQAKELLALPDRTKDIGKRDYALLILLLKTGIRRTECASLTIGDMTTEQGHNILIIEHGKGDTRGIVKLRVDVKRAIDDYLEVTKRISAKPDEPLFIGFTKSGKVIQRGIGAKAIEKIVKGYAARMQVDRLTPHGLRASFVTIALENGATLHEVQYAARHKDPRTTERYQKRKVNLDKNAVDKLDF